MKKLITIVTVMSLLLSCCVIAGAAECAHSYTATEEEATCIEKAHILYTCASCGHTYKEYKDSPALPEGFYILADSVRDEDTLTVTVRIGNNPGIWAAKLTTAYNGEALALREALNGDVWADGDYTGGWNTASNPFSTYVEDRSEDEINYNNGVFFTVVFDVIDDSLDYGIEFSHTAGSFPVWDNATNTIIRHTPEIINIIGASELGDHSYEQKVVAPTCTEGGYTENTCIYCADSFISAKLEATGHDWSLVKMVAEPTLTDEGLAEYICNACAQSEERSVPVLERYKKGDIDNDGDVTPKDANILLRFLMGETAGLQQFDAADCIADGVLNGKDSNKMKRAISGAESIS